MINLNNYIVEKLKLNKNIKLLDDFNECLEFVKKKFNELGYNHKVHILNHSDNNEQYIYVVINSVLSKFLANKITKEIEQDLKDLNLLYKVYFNYEKNSGVNFASCFKIEKIK